MKNMRTIIIFSWILLSFSVIVFAQPPIEIIYLRPLDVKSPSQADLKFIRDAMAEVQGFFALEMDRHGFGMKTFDFNEEIPVVSGKLKAEDYSKMYNILEADHEIKEPRIQNRIEVIFLGGRGFFTDPPSAGISVPVCWYWPGQNQKRDDCNYIVMIPIDGERKHLLPILAHEIGHAFGLKHTEEQLLDDGQNIMYSAFHVEQNIKAELKDFGITRENAIFLNEWGRLTIQENLIETVSEIDADINNDGLIDLSDVLIVRRAMQNSVLYDTDVNNDGITDEIDVLIVKQKAMEAIVAAAPTLIRRKKITSWGTIKRR